MSKKQIGSITISPTATSDREVEHALYDGQENSVSVNLISFDATRLVINGERYQCTVDVGSSGFEFAYLGDQLDKFTVELLMNCVILYDGETTHISGKRILAYDIYNDCVRVYYIKNAEIVWATFWRNAID